MPDQDVWGMARITPRQIILAVALLAIVFLFEFFGGPVVAQPKPRLSDAQKLEIRNAQIDFFTAQANLQASPVYQQFQKAQQHLNETAQKVTKEAGVDPAKFSLGPDLEFTPVPQKEKKNAGESPAPPTLR